MHEGFTGFHRNCRNAIQKYRRVPRWWFHDRKNMSSSSYSPSSKSFASSPSKKNDRVQWKMIRSYDASSDKNDFELIIRIGDYYWVLPWVYEVNSMLTDRRRSLTDQLIELQLIYYWRSSSNSRRMLSLSLFSSLSDNITSCYCVRVWHTHTHIKERLQTSDRPVVRRHWNSVPSFLPLRCEFSCDDLRQESFGKSRETFFPDIQNDPVSFTRDSRDHRCSGHSQYKRPLFVVSDDGISHASCVHSKLTPYLL